ncbi:MAG: aminotransferase class V-fold PLP-dependent enzyme [Pseudomonadota bacterium]
MSDGEEAALSRRRLLAGSGLALGAAALAGAARGQEAPREEAPGEEPPTDPDFHEPDEATAAQVRSPPPSAEPIAPGTVDWNWVRSQWEMNWSLVDLSAMLFASNPRLVRFAIDRHRKGLDASPTTYLESRNRPLQNAARAAAGAYFGAAADDIALVESTTSGVGLLYGGLDLRYGQEVLTTVHDYYVTHESLRLACARRGASLRKISLIDRSEEATIAQIVGRIVANIRPETKVLALTWVHSSTGLKMPIRAIADALAPINAARAPHDRVLFCVDGVHGFGVENATLPRLGCDFLIAGCHKWLFGPRGTGVIIAAPGAWSRVTPTIPSFLAPNAYGAWLGGYDPGPTTGARMTPGGFKAFEHVWALTEAFQFHNMVGKQAIEARTQGLAAKLKLGLSNMPHVSLKTPMDSRLSAGIVSFDVAGMSADGVVRKLRGLNIIASAAPYAKRHVRLTPSMRNSVEEIDFALGAIRRMGRG